MRFIPQPDAAERLGDLLKTQLGDVTKGWQEFRAAVAFVKRGGAVHVADELAAFAARGSIRMSVGVDLLGTSREGLQVLLDSVSAHGGEVWIFHNADPARPTFHPKIYLFKKADAALLIIGSGNLTQGGLFTNYEAGAAIELDLADDADAVVFRELEAVLDAWIDPSHQLARILTPEFLAELEQHGLVETETRARGDEVPEPERDDEDQRAPDLFGRRRVPRPPARADRARERAEVFRADVPESVGGVPEYFVISVLEGDLPQAGSSNEIRITKGIRDVKPTFWDWPDHFNGPDAATGAFHRDIRVLFRGDVLGAYLKDFPGKKPDGTKASADFRMGSIAPIVHELREEDDLVILTRSADEGLDFIAEVVNKSNRAEHEKWADGMIQHTRARSTSTGTYKKYRYVS